MGMNDSDPPWSPLWPLYLLLFWPFWQLPEPCFESAPNDGSPYLPLVRGLRFGASTGTWAGDLFLSSLSYFLKALLRRSRCPKGFEKKLDFLWLLLAASCPPTSSATFDGILIWLPGIAGLLMKLLTVVRNLLLFGEPFGEPLLSSCCCTWWPLSLRVYSFAHKLFKSLANSAKSLSAIFMEPSVACFFLGFCDCPEPITSPPGFYPEIKEPMLPIGSIGLNALASIDSCFYWYLISLFLFPLEFFLAGYDSTFSCCCWRAIN